MITGRRVDSSQSWLQRGARAGGQPTEGFA
jgi:hypothetical protein